MGIQPTTLDSHFSTQRHYCWFLFGGQRGAACPVIPFCPAVREGSSACARCAQLFRQVIEIHQPVEVVSGSPHTASPWRNKPSSKPVPPALFGALREKSSVRPYPGRFVEYIVCALEDPAEAKLDWEPFTSTACGASTEPVSAIKNGRRPPKHAGEDQQSMFSIQ